MFWVMTAFTMPRRSSSATASWAGLGSWPASMSMRGRWKLQKRSGSVRNTEQGRDLHRVVLLPDALRRERKSGMPLSVETPAPVSTTACSAPASSVGEILGRVGHPGERY